MVFRSLFSGSTQGALRDEHHTFDALTPADALVGPYLSFIGYVEAGTPSMQSLGSLSATRVQWNGTCASSPIDVTCPPTINLNIPQP
jgi:hypothetical protein